MKFDPIRLVSAQGRLRLLAQGITYSEESAVRLTALEASSVLAALAELERLKMLLDAPELHDFARGTVLEAAHQRERWGAEHDAGKAPSDWFWLVGFLVGKALHAVVAGDTAKALHHCISTAAAMANWHAALTGSDTSMRPGISAKKASRA